MPTTQQPIRRRGRPKLTLQEYASQHLDFIEALQTSTTIQEASDKCGFSEARGRAIAKRLGYRYTFRRERYAR